jgi:hypothetical protein
LESKPSDLEVFFLESKPSDLEVFFGIQTFRFGSIFWNPNLQIWKYFLESKPSDLEEFFLESKPSDLEEFFLESKPSDLEVFFGIQTFRFGSIFWNPNLQIWKYLWLLK